MNRWSPPRYQSARQKHIEIQREVRIANKYIEEATRHSGAPPILGKFMRSICPDGEVMVGHPMRGCATSGYLAVIGTPDKRDSLRERDLS